MRIFPWLMALLLLNLSVFAWNALSPQVSTERPVLVEAGIPALELKEPGGDVVYSSASAPNSSSCYTLGPYNSEKAAQLVAGKINAFGLATQMRTLRSLETLSFLVYIPPQPTYGQAEKIVQDLAKFEVKDYFIINEGPYKNAVSLGFFDDLGKAKRHAEYIRYLGYDAHYTEQQAAREVFWLDYDEPFGSNTPVQAWSAAIDATSEVQQIPRACR